MPSTNPTGKALLRASLDLFRQDLRMIWLPVMASISALAAFAIVSLPIGLALHHTELAVLLALFCGSVAANMATVVFNVALVFAATDRIEGRTPTVGGSLAKAWGRKHVIFRWALLSAVVGMAIRAFERRFGLLGRLIGIAGALAWAVATYLVIPVLAFEDVGPIEAVKRSSHILKERFGTIARGALRFGFLFVGLSIGAMVVLMIGIGVASSSKGAAVIGVPIAVVGFALLIGVSMYAAAAGMYMRTILYRFATDQPLPELGVDVSRTFGASASYGATASYAGPPQPSYGAPQPTSTLPTPPPPPARVPPGWYPDGAGERWWDGLGWTDYTR